MSKELLSFQDLSLEDSIHREFILNHGHIKVNPINVRNKISREPLFIVAGVQVLDSIIHNDSDFSSDRLLVFQPSIRLKSLSLVPTNPYTFSSFINVASLAINRSVEEHRQVTDDWIDFLNKIGIPKISTSSRETVTNWGRGEFNNEVTDIFSKGVHIGDSVFRTNLYHSFRGSFNVSDISFGYERLLYSIGSSDNIFNNTERAQIDLLRTLTLVLGSVIMPENKTNVNRKVQLLIKNLDSKMVDLERITEFYNWWSRFTHLQVSAKRIHQVMFESKFKS